MIAANMPLIAPAALKPRQYKAATTIGNSAVNPLKHQTPRAKTLRTLEAEKVGQNHDSYDKEPSEHDLLTVAISLSGDMGHDVVGEYRADAQN